MTIEPTSFIVVAVFVLTVLAVAYGLKTRKGSGINKHPGPASQDPDADGSERDLPETDRDDGSSLDQHGTK